MLTPNGGVFGRNPKFNSVTVENNLTVNGDFTLGDDIVINDTLLVNGQATFRGGIISIPNSAAPTSNTVLGNTAGAALQSGATDNVLLGATAGDSITTGDQCIVIGSGADVAAATNANSIVIGHGTVGNGSNTTTIGNSSTTGTFIPAGSLSVQSGIVEAIQTAGNNSGRGVFARNSTQSQSVGLVPAAGNDGSSFVGTTTNNQLQIRTNTTTRMTVGTDGNVSIANGNLVMSTAGTGIDFSATTSGTGTMTSELLSDYEEGTWTPTIEFGGASSGVTYLAQNARYTKVGRLVTVNCYLALSSKGSSTGSASIAGLPFAIANTNSAYGAGAIEGDQIAFSGQLCIRNVINDTKLSLTEMTTGGTRTDTTDGDFANGSSLMMTFTYTV